MNNCVLQMMLKCGIPFTVKHYLAYMGDVTSLEELGEENLVEILDLIEDGILVDTDVQDGSRGCWPCIAGPDQMMLRRVMLTTDRGTETHVVRAPNNLEAFRMLWHEDVLEGFAVPLAN